MWQIIQKFAENLKNILKIQKINKIEISKHLIQILEK